MLAVLAMTFAAVPVASANGPVPSISPEEVEVVLFPGESVDVRKVIQTPAIPPDADVYFLVDTTGSMWDVIDQIKTDIGMIIPTIQAVAPGARFGLGEYRDFPLSKSVFAFNNLVPLGPDDGIGGGSDVSDAVGSLVGGGGGDGSEAQFYAFDQLMRGVNMADFYASTPSIIVWIGDAPGHDPVCSAMSGWASDATEAGVTAQLQAPFWGGAPITVVAISTTTGFANALDHDPTVSAYDYSGTCAIGGTAGQATRIATATGGVHLTDVLPADIAEAILTAVGSVEVDVEMASNCSPPISTTFAPPMVTVESGSVAGFLETIAVAADAPGGTYWCEDWALIGGEPMVDEAGAIIYEYKTIKVPEGFVTGGGQIGKGKKAENFGGNVGFLADFSIVGQWNFRDGANKIHMHSLSIEYLQFFMIGGDPADPPTANANAAVFGGTARVKVGTDKWIDTCVFHAWIEDHGEPEVADAFEIGFDCGADGGPWFYGQTPLDTGNLQIHSGVKG
ncbi:MAG: vWA domain-containing protein [Actinomycetota bacterium]